MSSSISMLSLAFIMLISCTAQNHVDSVLTPDAIVVSDTLIRDTAAIVEVSVDNYQQTLEIFQTYAFLPNLMGTIEEAKDWLASEELPFSDVYSEEEGVYKLSFVISSLDEGTDCEFNFVYNSDYMESFRHIAMGITPPLQREFFFNRMDAWLLEQRNLGDISSQCYERESGDNGHVWEEQLKYGVQQTVLQFNAVESDYQWVELRMSNYKDVSDTQLVECD